jgi:hypothetical protein
MALAYLFFSTVTFSMALTLVVLLLVMKEKSTRGRMCFLLLRFRCAARRRRLLQLRRRHLLQLRRRHLRRQPRPSHCFRYHGLMAM